jgi:hypothetical protein
MQHKKLCKFFNVPLPRTTILKKTEALKNSLASVMTQREDTTYEPRYEPSPGTEIVSLFLVDFSTLRTIRNAFLLFTSYECYTIFLEQIKTPKNME